MARPKISVVVVFYNMRREAKRTLYSLCAQYQRGVSSDDYEVIAIDSNSPEPLAETDVTCFGKNFRYFFFESNTPSPAPALNYGAEQAAGDIVMCLIDGARMLSPRVLDYSLRAFKAYADPFVYTLSMHLGPKLQNLLILDGYDQQVEDRLLDTVDWRSNGYELFKVSSLAASNGRGFFSKALESNCVSLKKIDYMKLDGFDERFRMPGGGIVNLDFFNRLQKSRSLQPVMLLGEATFHQFHGGVATNVPMAEHPWQDFADEYLRIKGLRYETVWKPPHFLGHIPEECAGLFGDEAESQ